VLVGFPAPIALAGIAFGEYFRIFTPGISPILLSLNIIWIISAVHLCGLHVEEMFQNGATFLKIGLILVLIIGGLLMANPQHLDMNPGPKTLEILVSGPFAVSLVYVMYAYSGWNAATYITEEVRNPQRTFPGLF
jgi:APA family basic amino acid/polyamine antiporter